MEASVDRYFSVGMAGCTGFGPAGVGLMAGSGMVGVTSAPASYAALKVVRGGVWGGRIRERESVSLSLSPPRDQKSEP